MDDCNEADDTAAVSRLGGGHKSEKRDDRREETSYGEKPLAGGTNKQAHSAP